MKECTLHLNLDRLCTIHNNAVHIHKAVAEQSLCYHNNIKGINVEDWRQLKKGGGQVDGDIAHSKQYAKHSFRKCKLHTHNNNNKQQILESKMPSLISPWVWSNSQSNYITVDTCRVQALAVLWQMLLWWSGRLCHDWHHNYYGRESKHFARPFPKRNTCTCTQRFLPAASAVCLVGSWYHPPQKLHVRHDECSQLAPWTFTLTHQCASRIRDRQK